MSNLVNSKEPTFDCPDFLGEFEDTPSDRYCGTPYCYGASYFEPEWRDYYWMTGFSCACGCADQIYTCENPEDGWEMV